MALLLRRPPGREAYPGDVFYLHSPPARARGAPERRERRRLADRPADHRDAGRRRVGLHPDERDLDHRRPDLPRDRPVQRRPAARAEHRHLGVARRLGGPDEGDEEGRRRRSSSTSPSTARWRRSPSSRRDLDKATRDQLTRGEKLSEIIKQPQYQPLPVEKQVAILYAATTGKLDDVPTPRVKEFEIRLLPLPRDRAPEDPRGARRDEEPDRRARRGARRGDRRSSARASWRRPVRSASVASQRDIRRRIQSARNIKQITRAMQFVAASKLKRAQDATLAARPYARSSTRSSRTSPPCSAARTTRCSPSARAASG